MKAKTLVTTLLLLFSLSLGAAEVHVEDSDPTAKWPDGTQFKYALWGKWPKCKARATRLGMKAAGIPEANWSEANILIQYTHDRTYWGFIPGQGTIAVVAFIENHTDALTTTTPLHPTGPIVTTGCAVMFSAKYLSQFSRPVIVDKVRSYVPYMIKEVRQ